jgi:hypothetical protein
MTCQACRERLLEYVYGLLDAQDAGDAEAAREFDQHLQDCEACQAAHRRALEQKQLITRASKVSTDVRFVAPKAEPSLVSTDSRKKHDKKVVKQNAIAWYVTAASLLIALLAGSGGVYWWGTETKWKRVETARAEILQLDQKPAPDSSRSIAVEKRVEELSQQLIALRGEWKTKETEALAKAKAQRTYLQVIGPSAAEKDNPTNLLVVQRSLENQPQAIDNVNVKLFDETNNSVDEKTYQNRSVSNQYMVSFPKLAYRENNYILRITTDAPGVAAYAPTALNYSLEALHNGYVAHLATDKPLYQPGESVFFRVLALEKATLLPVHEELQVKFSLDGPDGNPIFTRDGKAQLRQDANTNEVLKDVAGRPLQGIAAASFQIPADAPSGEYTLRADELGNRFAFQQVKFMVNRAESPRFNKDALHFAKLSYLPGETVELSGTIKSAANHLPWPNGAVIANVLIDDKYYDDRGNATEARYAIRGTTDRLGFLRLPFRLPAQIQFGQAVVTLRVDPDAGDKAETWTQPLPITLHRPNIEFFPEGGDLIAGVHNRIYFMMRNAQGEPIDGQAKLLDESGSTVAEIETFRDESKAASARGMGYFTLTPKTAQNYRLAFSQEPTQKLSVRLPAVKPEGVVLHVEDGVLSGTQPVRITLQNIGAPRDLVAAVYCRGQLLGMQACRIADHEQPAMEIPIASPLGGVYRVTVFSLQEDQPIWKVTPVAERLIYRQPSQSLKLQVAAQNVNDHQVNVKIASKTEQQKPTPAYVTVAGVNQALLSLADDKTMRQLPAHFLLAQEVRDPEALEHADFFLSDHPSAKKALDLLLGVQGWRRFKEVEPVPIVANEQAIRSWNEHQPVVFDNRQQVLASIEAEVEQQLPKSEAKLLSQIQESERSYETARKANQEQKQQTLDEERALQRTRGSALTHLIAAEEDWQQFSNRYRVGTAGMVMIIGIIGALALFVKRRQLPTHLLATLGFAALVSIGIAGYLLIPHFPQIAAEPKAATVVLADKLPERLAPEQKSQKASEPARLPGLASSQAKEEHKPLAKWSGGERADERKKESVALSSAAPKSQPTLPPPSLLSQDREGKDASRAEPSPPSPTGRIAAGAAAPAFDKPLPGITENEKTEKAPTSSAAMRSLNQPRDQAKQDRPQKMDMGRSPAGQAYAQNAQNQRAISQSQLQQNLERMPQVRSATPETPRVAGYKDKTTRAEKKADPAKATADLKLGGDGFGGGGLGGGGLGGALGGRGAVQPTLPFFVREYAWNREHQPDNLKAMPWSQTLYWNPMIVMPSGETTIPLELPKTEGAYRINVFGHGGDGRLGAASIIIKTPLPTTSLSLQTKLSTDRAKRDDQIQLDIALTNNTNLRQNRVIAKIHLPDGVGLPPNFKLPRPSSNVSNPDEMNGPTTWSLKDKELTLSWDELPAGQKGRVSLSLICQKPGKFQAAGSRAYLENQENQAVTASPLQIVIDAP